MTEIEQDADGATVRAVDADGAETIVRCHAVVCCDGAASAFTTGLHEASTSYPTRWLTLIAAAPPSSRGTIYGLHRHGFAGQMHRSPTMTRFVLEVPRDEGFDEWPDDRLWAALEGRLAAAGRPPLARGEIAERDVLDLRVRVCDPMQDGRVFFAGDAAHLITPAGGKGMNIAVQDAVELAAALGERYGAPGDRGRLERYSQTRLPHVWRHQEFSNLMLGLFNVGIGRDSFSYGLRRARLAQVLDDPAYSRWFARAYVGVDD